MRTLSTGRREADGEADDKGVKRRKLYLRGVSSNFFSKLLKREYHILKVIGGTCHDGRRRTYSFEERLTEKKNILYKAREREEETLFFSGNS